MKQLLILVFIQFTTSKHLGQNDDSGAGFSFSYSKNNTVAIDMFGIDGKNRYHLGFGYQFNGHKNEVIKKL